MKTLTWMKRWILCLVLLCARVGVSPASGQAPESPTWLNYWSFSDTNNWYSDLGYAPVAFTNLNAAEFGDGTALVLDSTNAAWLRYNVVESNGTNNLAVDRGSVNFWFAPSWSSTNEGGTGPGQWGRLLEVGSYTANASYGWWSLYLDPEAANIYFAAQTNNGSQAVYLSSSIAWTTNRWHMITLTYSATNSSLYLDGALATNGTSLKYWPGPDVLTNGFYLGSSSNGVAQARGMFDDLSTYSYPLDAATISNTYHTSSFDYDINALNEANMSSAPSFPSYDTTFVAITGAGYLQLVGTNSTDCVTNSNIWITNVVATKATNGTMNLTFAIGGGSDGLFYDVFANSILSPATITNAWAWMGQGYHCNTYLVTNLPNTTAYLILGTPLNSDGDGLTDAYEMLVSKTDEKNPDTDGDGTGDGLEFVQGRNPRVAGTVADTNGIISLRVYTPLK